MVNVPYLRRRTRGYSRRAVFAQCSGCSLREFTSINGNTKCLGTLNNSGSPPTRACIHMSGNRRLCTDDCGITFFLNQFLSILWHHLCPPSDNTVFVSRHGHTGSYFLQAILSLVCQELDCVIQESECKLAKGIKLLMRDFLTTALELG